MTARRISAMVPWQINGHADLRLEIPDWTRDALCTEVGSDIFFPEKGESTAPAKKVCSHCPVINECLEWAIANDERFGVYGGKSERERRRIKRDRLATVGLEVAA
jgi:WhiB family redox-sensing transcriptional regulator